MMALSPTESGRNIVNMCVQEADMFSRSQTCRGKSHNPVAWMAGGRASDRLEPIDKAP
jgi:hypothetical protein